VIELHQADEIDQGDEIEVDFEEGSIKNISKEKIYKFNRYPEFLQEIIRNGGLMQWVKERYIKSE